MNPELQALHEPIVDAVMNRLQLHADSRRPPVASLAPSDLPPLTIDDSLRAFVEHGVQRALAFFSAKVPAWVPPHTFDKIESDIAEVVGNAAVALLDRLLALGPLPGA